MVHLTTRGLERVEKSPEGATVALLGWAFIQNSDDARNTPAEPYLAAMEEAGAKVRVHDPFVEEYPGIEVSHDLDATLAGADVVTIFTGHHHYASLEAARVKELSGQEHPVIVDGRNVVDPDAFIRAGFIYKGIGRGDKNSHPIRR